MYLLNTRLAAPRLLNNTSTVSLRRSLQSGRSASILNSDVYPVAKSERWKVTVVQRRYQGSRSWSEVTPVQKPSRNRHGEGRSRAVLRGLSRAARRRVSGKYGHAARRRPCNTTRVCGRVEAVQSDPGAGGLYELLRREAGFTRAHFDAALSRDPHLLSYRVEQEVRPRLSYLRFLHGKGELVRGAEAPADYLARQPQLLERRFAEIPTGNPLYFALNKPFRTRHDTPRGWGGNTPRYTLRYEGDISAEEWLHIRYPELDKIRFCHQLDFATEGILVAAATKAAAGAVTRLFKARLVRKQYLALLFGHPPRDTWTCDARLLYDEGDPRKFKMRAGAEGKECFTRFTVQRRGYLAVPGPHLSAPVAWVLVEPYTGRRHQIRLHAALSGHAIVGDSSYGPDADTHRMFLLAHSLHVPLDSPVARDNVGPPLSLVQPPPPAWGQLFSDCPLRMT